MCPSTTLRLPVAGLALALLLAAQAAPGQPLNAANPPSPVRLVFIHHSTGENWLRDEDGGLAIALRDASYFVSDTNYGWGPGSIGDRTDVGNWYDWFLGTSSATYLASLYAESDQSFEYSRLASVPAGSNQVVMFKSCFPNSNLQGSLDDPVPPIGSNPLRGQDYTSEHHTFANVKGIYQGLLAYFAAHTEKLFVLVTSPPLTEGSTSPEAAALARALNDWLVAEWLDGYAHHNVFVFDFFDVLTSNGGTARTDDPDTNDLDWDDGNHHRLEGGVVNHLMTISNGYSAYGYSWDDHPSQAGNLKATGEFVPLLNVAYHCWKGTGGCPTVARPAPTSLFHFLTPCRVLDTRLAAGGLGGPPLVAGTDRDFQVTLSPCGIPASATAISANVTVATPAAGGDLLVYPGDLADGGVASSVSFSPGRTRACQSIVGLAADGAGTVRIVNGYFE